MVKIKVKSRGQECPRYTSLLGDKQDCVLGQVAFAAEPVFHVVFQAVERDAGAHFEDAVGDGERVVEDGIVGEVAHGEVVEPFEGTGLAFAVVFEVDVNFAGEHKKTVKGKV